MYTLTKTERSILQAIWSAEDKTISYGDCRKAAQVTPRGFRTVFNRMRDSALLNYAVSGDRSEVTITFKGMRALGVNRAS